MSFTKRENMSLFWFNGAIPKQGYLKRVLIVHPHGIGDVLWITPVIRALSEYGVKRIDLLLGSRTREIFERNPHANEMFEWDKSPVANIFKPGPLFKNICYRRFIPFKHFICMGVAFKNLACPTPEKQINTLDAIFA